MPLISPVCAPLPHFLTLFCIIMSCFTNCSQTNHGLYLHYVHMVYPHPQECKELLLLFFVSVVTRYGTYSVAVNLKPCFHNVFDRLKHLVFWLFLSLDMWNNLRCLLASREIISLIIFLINEHF